MKTITELTGAIQPGHNIYIVRTRVNAIPFITIAYCATEVLIAALEALDNYIPGLEIVATYYRPDAEEFVDEYNERNSNISVDGWYEEDIVGGIEYMLCDYLPSGPLQSPSQLLKIFEELGDKGFKIQNYMCCLDYITIRKNKRVNIILGVDIDDKHITRVFIYNRTSNKIYSVEVAALEHRMYSKKSEFGEFSILSTRLTENLELSFLLVEEKNGSILERAYINHKDSLYIEFDGDKYFKRVI